MRASETSGTTVPNERVGARILLLDDDLATARLVREVLDDERYLVEWAPNAGTAMSLMETDSRDVVLVDIYLQNGTGWEFVEWCRRRYPAVPVVMVTGSSREEERRTAFRFGADRYLVEPLVPSMLRRVIDEVIQSRRDEWWSGDGRQSTSVSQLLHDPTTETGLLTLALESLRESLGVGESLDVFCIRLEPLVSPGAKFGWDAYDELRRDFVRGLHLFLSSSISNGEALLATSHPGANDFYLFAPAARFKADEVALEEESHRILAELANFRPGAEELNVVVGTACTRALPYSPERLLYDAVREASDRASRRENRYLHHLESQLRMAIRDEGLSTVFQPIVRLDSLDICGYEALSRGPAGSEIESPDVIFRIARDTQLVWDLEKLCIGNLLPYMKEVLSQGRLFVNLESQFVQLLDERGFEVLDGLADYASSVVLEVTERSAIRDFRRFRSVLQKLKSIGFAIAIDDCGSGYASLEAIAELVPDYLKVGHGLFQGVMEDPIRRRLVELVAGVAEAIGAETIAEAIETDDQRKLCMDLGIRLGQGYIFARPSPWEIASGYRHR